MSHPESSPQTRTLPAAEAVQAHLSAVYKGRRPRHFATIHTLDPGGPDPLTGISVWKRVDPQPHWHYVTHGLSTPRGTPPRKAGASGFGFELTFRVQAGRDEAEPPLWPLELLHNLARYVARTGNPLESGHRMSANGPLAPGSNTQLCAMGFADDPEAEGVHSADGRIDFLQVVALSAEEERAAECWDTRQLLDALRTQMPLWITALHRQSLLAIPDIDRRIKEGTARDGSSTGVVFTDVLDVDVHKRFLRKPLVDITVGAQQIAKLAGLLPLRLPFRHPLTLSGPSWRLHFTTADRNNVQVDGNMLVFSLNDSTVESLRALLRSGEGTRVLADLEDITWHVKRTVIRNAQGDIVTVIA